MSGALSLSKANNCLGLLATRTALDITMTDGKPFLPVMIITLVRDPWYRVSSLGRSILLIGCRRLASVRKLMLMTTGEEIVVSGDNFIERRIFVQQDVPALRDSAYRYGYRRGWTRGFVMGLALFAIAILGAWVIVH